MRVHGLLITFLAGALRKLAPAARIWRDLRHRTTARHETGTGRVRFVKVGRDASRIGAWTLAAHKRRSVCWHLRAQTISNVVSHLLRRAAAASSRGFHSGKRVYQQTSDLAKRDVVGVK